MKLVVLFSLLALILLAVPTSADRGMIPLTPAILEEAEQNAIIAWNGSEEILILSTNVKASENATVLELLPLPSKPEVEKASMESFHRLIEILNRGAKGPGLGAGRGDFTSYFSRGLGCIT